MSDVTPSVANSDQIVLNSALLRDHLRLALVPGLGPKLTAAVLAHFGSPTAVLRANARQLMAVPLIGEKLANSFVESFRTVDVAAEERLLQKHDVRFAVLGEGEYPARLTTLVNAPAMLYLKGTLADADTRAVGIVGSRNCTTYGKRMAERIAAGLARAGWTVISGLARGIDGCAHRGALDAGGRTLAVLAGGLSKIYPPEHTDLAQQVARQGCLISETPMTVEPQPGMFPARNRIISGLSRAIVVIEANAKSGALITVDHAAEQGREVFALPGNVDSPASVGCLDLIRKGAKLVRDADDILEDLQGISPPDPPAKRATTKGPTLFESREPAPPPPQLEGIHKQVWDVLTSPKHADELCREVGVSLGELTKMEMKKIIRRLPGNQYERRT